MKFEPENKIVKSFEFSKRFYNRGKNYLDKHPRIFINYYL